MDQLPQSFWIGVALVFSGATMSLIGIHQQLKRIADHLTKKPKE